MRRAAVRHADHSLAVSGSAHSGLRTYYSSSRIPRVTRPTNTLAISCRIETLVTARLGREMLVPSTAVVNVNVGAVAVAGSLASVAARKGRSIRVCLTAGPFPHLPAL